MKPIFDRFLSVPTISQWAILALFMPILSCKTVDQSDPVRLNNAQTDGSIYSTSDLRTGLNNADRIERLKSLEQNLRDFIKVHPSDLQAIANLAQVLVVLDDLSGAENQCRVLLRKDLKNQDARRVLAQIAIRRGQYDLASIHLTNIGGVNSRDSSVINMLAQLELQKGNPTYAMALFKKAIRLDPQDSATRMNLGVLYVKYRQMPLASVEFERILKSDPGHVDAKVHLAIVKIARGENAEAKEMLEGVLDIDDSNPLALYNLAVISKHEKDFDEAISYLKRYIESGRGVPKDNELAFNMLNQIQRFQTASGESVSDDDIQEMAAASRKASSQRRNPRATASSGNRSNSTNRPIAAKRSSQSNGESESEEISDLERALK